MGDFGSGWPVEPEDHSFLAFLPKARDAVYYIVVDDSSLCGGVEFQ